MQKYIALRIHTALYLSIFFFALHYVFAYLANSSVLSFFFNLSIAQILVIYGGASLCSILVYLWISSRKIAKTKSNIYLFTFLEMVALLAMYISSRDHYIFVFILSFVMHHLTTPYILYNLDILFESYTHTEDRGKGRGIYMTMWNAPFVIVPLLLSGLKLTELSIVYIVAFALLIPFILFIYIYIQEPKSIEEDHTKPLTSKTTLERIRHFWADPLDRKSFITQSTLHLYYGITGVFLPIYLYTYFGFDWDKIGLLLAVSLSPFILFQIHFGSLEDKEHNEKKLFAWGVVIVIIFTIISILVTPNTPYSFILLALFLFLSRVGCSLIEIATEGLFYKHVTERNEFALMAFRAGRLFPYILGLLGIFWLL
jgi:hypothetical protein